ncbi:hypothetical protein MKW92_013133, partial [Papaver armeniacum]
RLAMMELGSLKGRHPLLEDIKKKAVILGRVNFGTPPNDENMKSLSTKLQGKYGTVLDMANLNILILVRRLNGQSST